MMQVRQPPLALNLPGHGSERAGRKFSDIPPHLQNVTPVGIPAAKTRIAANNNAPVPECLSTVSSLGHGSFVMHSLYSCPARRI